MIKKKTEAAPVKARAKTSKVIVRKATEVRPFSAKSNVKPIRNIPVGDMFIEGATEDELIAEGVRQPYYVPTCFKKTKEEREALKKVKFKGRVTGWMASDTNKNTGRVSTLIVHVKNNKKLGDFKSTHSFKNVKETEINRVLNLFFPSKKDQFGKTVYNHVNCYYYAGKKITVK